MDFCSHLQRSIFHSILTVSHRGKEIFWWLYLYAALPSTELNCPMNPPMRKWISHWVTGCWITFYCLKIATLQQSVCPHLILSPNVPMGAQMGQENLLPAQCLCRAWNDNCAGQEINGSCIVLFAVFLARRGIKSMGTTVKCISLGMHWVICVSPLCLNIQTSGCWLL